MKNGKMSREARSRSARKNDELKFKWKDKYQIINEVPVFLTKLNNFKNQEKELAESQAEKYDISKKIWMPNLDIYQKALAPILKLPKNSLVLELGGGVSYASALILKKGLRLIETDIALKTVLRTKRYLRSRNLAKNAVFLVCDGENIPLENETLDAVFLISAFHHFEKPKKALQEIKRVLKPGGILILVAEPNRWPYQTIFPLTRGLRKVLRRKRKLDSVADDTIRGFSATDFQKLLEAAKLEVEMIAPTLFLTQFYAHFLLFFSRLFRIKLERKEKTEKILNKIDDFLTKIPMIKNYFWHWNVVVRKIKND